MSSTTQQAASNPSRKLKVLCLHGYTQNGPLFRAKTRALEKNVQKAIPAAPKPGFLKMYPGGVEFHYVTAEHKLTPADIPTFDKKVTTASTQPGNDHSTTETKKKPDTSAFDGAGVEDARAWWKKESTTDAQGKERIVYRLLPETLEALATTMREQGPFDAVLGFSQGASLSVILTALLEPGRAATLTAARERDPTALAYPTAFLDARGEQAFPPLRLAVNYSGFRAPEGNGYDALYEGGLSTPSLHVIGSMDTVVEEGRCLALFEACRGGSADTSGQSLHRVVYHPGGHFVPASQRPTVDALIQFIRDIVGESSKKDGGDAGEERVEDMNLPF